MSHVIFQSAFDSMVYSMTSSILTQTISCGSTGETRRYFRKPVASVSDAAEAMPVSSRPKVAVMPEAIPALALAMPSYIRPRVFILPSYPLHFTFGLMRTT